MKLLSEFAQAFVFAAFIWFLIMIAVEYAL